METLSSKSLMIGDLVYCTYWPQKHIVRVWELKRVADDELKVVVMDEIPLVFQEKYIEPIRITEDMLIRWGFKFDGTNAYILEQRRGVHDPNDKPSYYIKVIPPQPDNDDWWSPSETGFEVESNNCDLLLSDQGDTYYHVLQHLLRQARLEDVVKLRIDNLLIK